ncbi:hypothetical protein M441DRAFT_318762 [Trichoderma asperellum CBS 433.97]|uniref:Uncharacterized protein n=1 Tax=Trichoderma asperellum (strain ATCC 204424 / CBS 433.97 / NBRC 101777) TaxID=1042311 RepID=A0A2T3ZL10_TRIA4|nr:hypothetical protein M441DRAFT_318762 [Trichoderma asperellum CBS 433.97]PTB45495.1 hypothetical protein M441DRAFT_318762 [Trichoderma asperellum CBS 433.97]
MRFLCNVRVLHICVHAQQKPRKKHHTGGLYVSPGKVFRPNKRIKSRPPSPPVRTSEYHSIRTINARLSGVGCTTCFFHPFIVLISFYVLGLHELQVHTGDRRYIREAVFRRPFSLLLHD